MAVAVIVCVGIGVAVAVAVGVGVHVPEPQGVGVGDMVGVGSSWPRTVPLPILTKRKVIPTSSARVAEMRRIRFMADTPPNEGRDSEALR